TRQKLPREVALRPTSTFAAVGRRERDRVGQLAFFARELRQRAVEDVRDAAVTFVQIRLVGRQHVQTRRQLLQQGGAAEDGRPARRQDHGQGKAAQQAAQLDHVGSFLGAELEAQRRTTRLLEEQRAGLGLFELV